VTLKVPARQLGDQGVTGYAPGLDPPNDPSARSSGSPRPASFARFEYAVGGVATGIIASGLGAYLLLYYNLVLGVSASLVGAVLAIALIFDAFVDPAVGYWSDNLRSRWGRRHPLMYGALIPVPVLFYMLWNPPLASLGSQWLFPYLMITTVALRLLLTCYEVPSNALVPELTDDYDERTRLLNFRITAYNITTTGLQIALYGYWLRDTPAHPNGLLNAGGYESMGLWGAVIILVTMLISSAGLHRFIPILHSPPPKPKLSPRWLYLELRGALADRSLVALLVAAVFYSAANGAINALWAYMYSYYWGLSSQKLSILVVIMSGSALLALLLTQKVSPGRDKPVVARTVLGITLLMSGLPASLRMLGLFPANGSAWLFALLGMFALLEITFYVMTQVMFAAMLTDLVEKRQLVTGTRQEGLLSAMQMFIMKLNSGLGLWLAGIALDVIHFPTSGGTAVYVPPETIYKLGVVYAPSMMFVYGLGVFALRFFRITRADHYRHLQELAGGR
jgi:Na+/melibiose symporter-like transporter